jgi:hypothetical protein
MTSFIKTHTNTKINLKVNSKKHKQIFSRIKNNNSIKSDIDTLKFLLDQYEQDQSFIKSLKRDLLNQKLINSIL